MAYTPKTKKDSAPESKAPVAETGILLVPEFQEGYEFNGKLVPDKFVIETADAVFSISTERCKDDPEVMLDMLQSGMFQPAIDKETKEPILDGSGKQVYSVPFSKNRTKTDSAGRRLTGIVVGDNTPANDPYKDVIVPVTKRNRS